MAVAKTGRHMGMLCATVSRVHGNSASPLVSIRASVQPQASSKVHFDNYNQFRSTASRKVRKPSADYKLGFTVTSSTIAFLAANNFGIADALDHVLACTPPMLLFIHCETSEKYRAQDLGNSFSVFYASSSRALLPSQSQRSFPPSYPQTRALFV